ncbi:flagellar basal body-associated FliL family protein [Sphaerotilus sp.]|uniref:flagellar basal body-associated FliL family protein n=1 Tax=Sphaerotilus sp. TaxID=2093942 RepID=UPI002ACE548D|nr:flagellar basal body-associated FliL family protein [Sphaerotilus sp.]MDZ7857646.1 flagellar basal body-associated FliL family protein [Sphaerotilus sp.]
MSAAAASAETTVAKKGSKKLWIIIGVVLLLVAGGGGGYVVMQRKAAAAEADGADHGEAADAAPARKPQKRDPKTPPAYLPMDPFVVNLADRDSDRYAQIGITLEIDDPKFADEMKAYMPAIRNAILMILSHKTAADMLGREGKEVLAAEIAREAVRPLGINIDVDSDEEGAPVKKKRRAPPVYNPVQHVHFSSFIVQ